jgi:hypothetical protein
MVHMAGTFLGWKYMYKRRRLVQGRHFQWPAQNGYGAGIGVKT